MPDWKALVAARLASLKLRPEREREIIDELSQHLGDRFQELRADGVDEAAAVRVVMDEIDDYDLLAREMRTLKQSSVARANRRRHAAAPPVRGSLSGSRLCGAGHTQESGICRGRRRHARPRHRRQHRHLQPGQRHAARAASRSRSRSAVLRVAGADGRQSTVSYPVYASLRDATRLIESVAAWAGITASLNADGETDLVSGAIVTGNFFETLGAQPARGLLLTAADDRTPGAHPVVVISHRLWLGRFGGRADIIGHERAAERTALHDHRRDRSRFSGRGSWGLVGHLHADDDASLDASAAWRLFGRHGSRSAAQPE